MDGNKPITHYYSDARTMYEVFLRGLRESSEFSRLRYRERSPADRVHPSEV